MNYVSKCTMDIVQCTLYIVYRTLLILTYRLLQTFYDYYLTNIQLIRDDKILYVEFLSGARFNKS